MDAATIDWQSIDDHQAPSLGIGEIVSAEAGGMPIYQVMGLVGGAAWLRDVETGGDRVMPLSALHWRAGV